MASFPYRHSTLSDAYVRHSRELREQGVRHADMRNAASLETQFSGGMGGLSAAPARLSEQLRRLEGADPILRMPVLPAAPGESRIAGFLDGSQRTVSAWRIGLVPVIATVAAAAVITRTPDGEAAIARDREGNTTLRMEHRWLIPLRSGDAQVDRLVQSITSAGGAVSDPVARKATINGEVDQPTYDAWLNDYSRLVEIAYDAARQVRVEVEMKLLDEWPKIDATERDWLIVDGRRALDVPRTLGVVKRVSSQYLTGAEAVQVYDLPVGHRTSAFVPNRDKRGGEIPYQGRSPHAVDANTSVMWFLRMHDHAGLDAYHGLVRVEAPSDTEDSADITSYSSWLLAERTPRATGDARWASLLYPIHLLERVLKRQIAAETRAWPNAS
ncbi:MAG TPA: hypothetical protein VGT61_14075 [Thermomicrobiales bacterium]|nr:hypothetical protein [Thermomicrobiales bacterium]